MSTHKPTHDEDEYFARVEIEKRRNLAEKVRSEMAADDLAKLKKLHHMHCANCGFEMHPVIFKGVTIEQCPNCDGIFLKQSELDELAGKKESVISTILNLFNF